MQITVAEILGVEGRGDYYDHSGALRDMVQNHMLQLLCLTTMEPPSKFEPDAIRDEKRKVLRALRPFTEAEVATHTVRGQYRAGVVGGAQVPGYNDEIGRSDDPSSTETFVAIKGEIANWRWGACRSICARANGWPDADPRSLYNFATCRTIFSRLAISGSLPTD